MPSVDVDSNYADNGPQYPQYIGKFIEGSYPPYKPRHDGREPGLAADPTFPNLFPRDKEHTTNPVTPKIGSEVTGVQLSQLTPEGLDELALYVAQRGVVAFRAQDLKDAGTDKLLELGRHFGPLHIHPTTAHPEESPFFHVIYRDRELGRKYLETESDRNTSIIWHSDVTYEANPPSTTFLLGLEVPPTGGDTIFASTTEAYRHLSPAFRERLHGLRAVHSSVGQATESRSRGGPTRRPDVETEHPLIRRHPVTGEPVLYISDGFTTKIVGYKKEESDNLIRFLLNHIAFGQDFQARIRWEPGTVVVWDNRNVVHTAVFDYSQNHRRHALRITPQGEVPVAFQ